jgi:Tol biopolymer transport system component/DNA-binding winged helix-turn-helix (wHTH) protein
MSDGPSSPNAPGRFVVRTDDTTWRVAPDLNRVTPSAGAPTQLEPRVMQVLVALARRAGTVVSRDDLLDEVWTNTVVNEEALTRAVSELRRAFDDSAQDPAVIETIRGTGYRFVATVESAESADAAPAPESETTDETSWHVRPTFIGAAVGAITIIVAAAVGALSLEDSTSAPTLLETTPFTSFQGRERFPALSPDGSRAAFAWTGGAEDNYDIYLKQENTADPLRLTDHPAGEGFPAWSPDGTTVAYIRVTDSTHVLYTVPALGGTPRKLIETRSAFYGLDWSPDGESLLYSDQLTQNGPYRVMRLALATRDTTVLTAPPASATGDLFARWAPDGRTIAFSRDGEVGGHTLYRMNADGSNVRSLKQGELSIRGLDWTADGRHVVYASYQSGTYGLWRVNVENESVSWVPTHAERIYNPTVADQTGALVYEELTYEKDVWELDLAADSTAPDGGPPSRPLLTSTRWDCEAYYSPDGDRLVFTSSRSGALELWMSDADGTNPTKLTDFGGAFVGNPRWHPSGNRIAFFANVEGQAGIYVMDVPGGSPEQVRALDGDANVSNDWVTSWSRDGEWLYFASDRSGWWQLWKMNPDGSALTQVTESGGFAAKESVSGDSLFYTKREARGLWMRPTGGGPETKVLDDLSTVDWGNWTITAEGLYYIRRTDDGPRIVFRDDASGETRVAAAIPNIASPSLEVSPDGQRILYARIEGANSDLIMAKPHERP